MSKLIFWEKQQNYRQFVIFWIRPESSKGL